MPQKSERFHQRERGLEIRDEESVGRQFLDLQILYLLRSGPKTLYSMRAVLFDAFGVQRSFGTIHPHLSKLEKLGLIEGIRTVPSRAHFPKHYYKLTAKGKRSLEREVRLLSNMVIKMARKRR
jgi:DNA-binding PadR family transcriptional regulator